ncbi:MAG: tetratricopeptide repeat protein [Microcystaceae cyanobacterium]
MSSSEFPQLDAALTDYESLLSRWKNSETPDCEQAVNILMVRDNIQKILATEKQVTANLLERLVALDHQLQENAALIAQSLDLAAYRNSLSISSQNWWWNLDSTVESDSSDKFAWFWRGTRFGVWTMNLGLLGTLATRFFSGASGLTEVLTIALPSILVLLQANNELTSSGQEGFNRLFNRLKIPPHLYEQVKFIPTASLFGFLLIIWFLQPQFSQEINREGRRAEEKGQLTNAEQHYLKALTLDANNLDATYNLGNLYEELQNFDNAKKYYVIAAKGGFADAYNNLGRLYIRQNQYSEAILLLNDGLEIVEKQEQQAETSSQGLNEVKYSLLKNLGWAKLRQSEALGNSNKLKSIDYTEAKFHLLVAIGIASDPELKSSILNPGAAHCLLAMVLEVEDAPDSLAQWRQCYDLVSKRLGARDVRNPEEEAWFALAKQKLTLAGETLP